MITIKNSLYIIIAGILWGIVSIFVNLLKETGFNSMQIVSVRTFFSAVVLVLYLLIKDKTQLKIKLKDIPLFIGTGVCSIIFFNFCYFEAIEVIGGAAVPALLLYTSPIFVMIISLFLFKEKITGKKLISLIMAFTGLALVTGAFSGGENISVRAVFLGLGSGLGYALYSIFGKFLVDKYSAVTITAYTFIVASIFSVPFSDVIQKTGMLLSVKAILSALALSIISTVLPFLFYTRGLNGMEAGKASILAAVEPFVAAIVGVIFFNEDMTTMKITGMIMLLLAIVILNVSFKREKINSD